MKYIIMLTAFIFLSCNNCKQNKLEKKIAKHIKKTCNTGECLIDLSVITNFEWNKLCVFNESAPLETVECVINGKYTHSTDVSRKLIFLDDSNNMVHYEDIFPNVENVCANDVIFNIPDTTNYRVFENSFFKVKKVKSDDIVYFELDQ